MSSRLGPKLETAFVRWLREAKGDLLDGVNICDAHGSAEPTPPYIAVWCASAPVHPDLTDLPGASWPRRASVRFTLKATCEEGGSFDDARRWSEELHAVLTQRAAGREEEVAGDFTAFIEAANPGGALHDSGLVVFGISLAEDASGAVGTHWTTELVLEVDAQNYDDANAP